MTVETGRGTRDVIGSTRTIGGLAASLNIDFGFGSTGGDLPTAGVTLTIGTINTSTPSTPSADTVTIGIGVSPGADTVIAAADIPITVTAGESVTVYVPRIVTALNTFASSFLTASLVLPPGGFGDTTISINIDAEGRVSAPIIAPTNFFVLIDDFEDGHAGRTELVESEYIFDGPFDNTIPVGDPLQGMVRYAEHLVTFFDDVADANSFQDIITAAGDVFDVLNTDFPPTIINGGDHPEGRIPIKGTFRGPSRTDILDADRLVGRGKPRVRYTNSVANYGVVQLILRRLDSFFDLMADIRANDLADIKVFAAEIDESFNLEADGSLPRARGFEPIAYDNTIVDRTAEQGLLVYCDRIYGILNTLRSAANTDIDALRAGIGVNTDISKLDLRN